MGLHLRPITAEEFDAFRYTMGVPFGFDPTPEHNDRARHIVELERLRAAFDGPHMVATFGAFSLTLTVPGSTMPTAGTTMVSVLPTHRRHGLLRRFMAQHLGELHECGEPLAALWASESSIYGRFGYGPACDRVLMRLDKPFAHMQHPVDIHGTMRLVDAQEALATFPAIFAAIAARRPGMYARSTAWWQHRILDDPPDQRRGATAQRCVMHVHEGQPVGYVLYRTQYLPQENLTVVWVGELIATTPTAEKALWQFVFGIDLIASIRAQNRPLDDPLCWWLEQPRRMQRRIEDGLWVRVVNLGAALTCRRYTSPGRLLLRVIDDLCPWNDGVYCLEVGLDGVGQCTRTRATPELELTAYALGAGYLGGHRFGALARAGLVSGTSEVLQRADAMFAWDPLPWCHEVF
jgi:predicted acetyltransferase